MVIVDGDFGDEPVFRIEILREHALEFLRAYRFAVFVQHLEAPARRVGKQRRLLDVARGQVQVEQLGGIERAVGRQFLGGLRQVRVRRVAAQGIGDERAASTCSVRASSVCACRPVAHSSAAATSAVQRTLMLLRVPAPCDSGQAAPTASCARHRRFFDLMWP